jgi:hypothetical protein
MLLENNNGVDWTTFPKPGATLAAQIAAQESICARVTSEMDALAQTLRATVNVEQEQGPDFAVTTRSNGWVRFRSANWPIIQIVGAQCCSSGLVPPTWTSIPVAALMTEHTGLPATGSIVPTGATGPTAILIGPGYVDWANGRNGYLIQITTISGFPVAGIDVAANAGDHFIHVDDITGWWNGTAGARGIIYDSPYREEAVVAGATPDVTGAITGPGTLLLTQALSFNHVPIVGPYQPAQRVLFSAMPSALITAGLYLATYYGLVRGATGAVMQSSRGVSAPSGKQGANTWRDDAKEILSRWARSL